MRSVNSRPTTTPIAAGITASEVAGIPTFYANRGQRTEPLPINGVWEHLDSLREEYRVTSEDVKEFGRSPLALKGLKAATVNLTIIGLKGLSARGKMSRLRAATKALDIKPNEANGPLGLEIYIEVVEEAIRKTKDITSLRDLLDKLVV